ncbi:MAG: oligosaccharide flippase family protein [Thermoleophilaceae bacterium]|nr:oligosaccharide flippase family protein [Thermoleophilaceae bacterium]
MQGFVASFAIQVALVVTGVVAARALGVHARGELAFLLLVPTVLTTLGGAGIPVALAYFVARKPASATSMIRMLLPVGIAQAVALAAIGMGIVTLGLDLTAQEVTIAAVITLLSIPPRLLHVYGVRALQGRRRFLAFNVLRSLPTAGYAAGALILFMAGHATLVALAIAWTASFAVSGAITCYVSFREFRDSGTAQGPKLGALVRFGLKGALGWSSPVQALRIDQTVIGLFLAPAALGLYVVAQAFTNLPRFISSSVGAVAYPNIAAREDRQQARRTLGRFVLLGAVVSGLLTGSLAIFAGWLVPFFFGADFVGAVPTTRILLLGTFFWCVRIVLADGASGLGLPGLGTVAEVSSWAILLPALALLTPPWGIEGVAAALALSAATSLVVMVAGLMMKGMTPLAPALGRPAPPPTAGA